MEENKMTHVYFHCTSAERVMVDALGIDVEDFTEAHQRAQQVVRKFISSNRPDDWRHWTLHATDDQGEEIFVMPFAYMLGKVH
jgi:hypothetical protein